MWSCVNREPACLTHFTSSKHSLEFRIDKICEAYDDHWSAWNSHARNYVYVYCDRWNHVWRDTFYITDGNLNWITGRCDWFDLANERNQQTKHTIFEADASKPIKYSEVWNNTLIFTQFPIEITPSISKNPSTMLMRSKPPVWNSQKRTVL